MSIPSKKEIEAEFIKLAEKCFMQSPTNDYFKEKGKDFISQTRSHDLSAIIEWVKGEKGKWAEANNFVDADTSELVNSIYDKAIDDFVAHLTSLQENI